MERELAPLYRTARLVIRDLVESDRSAHEDLFSRPDVLRYLYDDVMDATSLAAHFERRLSRGAPAEGQWRNLAVEHEGTFIGEVGLTLVSDTHRGYEVGYVLSPLYHGLGFATEATRGIIDAAFGDLGAHRVSARLDARNEASRHLLERLGLRLEAHHLSNEYVKGEWTDELVFAVLEDEWARDR